MAIDLDVIQKMWEEDSKIDIDNLHTESLNVPILHSKYYELYNTINLLKTKAEKQKKKIRHEKYEYFTGKADPEVYIENPFPKKIRDKETLQGYLDSDEKLNQISLKVEYYEIMLEYIQSILKQISERNWQIRNSIEFMKFSSGLG
jgi:hypothetical protein